MLISATPQSLTLHAYTPAVKTIDGRFQSHGEPEDGHAGSKCDDYSSRGTGNEVEFENGNSPVGTKRPTYQTCEC